MEKLQFITRLIAFLVHVVSTAVLVNWIGEYMSQPINILWVIAAGVVLSALVVLIIYHLVGLVNLFRQITKTKKQ